MYKFTFEGWCPEAEREFNKLSRPEQKLIEKQIEKEFAEFVEDLRIKMRRKK